MSEDEFDRGQNLYARARFVAEAAGANLEQEAASADADRSPKWNGQSLADEYVRGLQAHNDAFEKKLERAQRSPQPPEDQQRAFREHILKAHANRSVREAAEIEKVSPSYIQQVRDEARKAQKRGSTH